LLYVVGTQVPLKGKIPAYGLANPKPVQGADSISSILFEVYLLSAISYVMFIAPF